MYINFKRGRDKKKRKKRGSGLSTAAGITGGVLGLAGLGLGGAALGAALMKGKGGKVAKSLGNTDKISMLAKLEPKNKMLSSGQKALGSSLGEQKLLPSGKSKFNREAFELEKKGIEKDLKKARNSQRKMRKGITNIQSSMAGNISKKLTTVMKDIKKRNK